MTGVKRGEIYYIERGYCEGSEQQAGRPAIIVSNDINNDTSTIVEIVYLTTQPKKDLPTHVEIRSATRPSTALCEQITTVSSDRIGDYISKCTDREMESLEIAMAISLGIDLVPCEEKEPVKTVEVEKVVEKEVSEEEAEKQAELLRNLIKIEAERDVYKSLYEKMLKKAMRE